MENEKKKKLEDVNFRGEAYAMFNGILLAIAKLKCRNPSIN